MAEVFLLAAQKWGEEDWEGLQQQILSLVNVNTNGAVSGSHAKVDQWQKSRDEPEKYIAQHSTTTVLVVAA